MSSLCTPRTGDADATFVSRVLAMLARRFLSVCSLSTSLEGSEGAGGEEADIFPPRPFFSLGNGEVLGSALYPLPPWRAQNSNAIPGAAAPAERQINLALGGFETCVAPGDHELHGKGYLIPPSPPRG